MSGNDQEWTQRHIAAFRFHRGHGACTVEGCTGSRPLMWVPTADEDGERAADEAELIVLSAHVENLLATKNRPNPWRSGLDHIHWAG